MIVDNRFRSWFATVEIGDDSAILELCKQYLPRMIDLGRRVLTTTSRAVADEEDVAISALHEFTISATKGRFDAVFSHDELWRILAEMTRHKAIDRVRRNNTEKNGGGRVCHFGAVEATGDGVFEVHDSRPSAELGVMIDEQILALLDELESTDPQLREAAVAKMNGCTNEELARRFDRSLPTIERWLQRIRTIGRRIM